jgi:hypothetical protein
MHQTTLRIYITLHTQHHIAHVLHAPHHRFVPPPRSTSLQRASVNLLHHVLQLVLGEFKLIGKIDRPGRGVAVAVDKMP